MNQRNIEAGKRLGIVLSILVYLAVIIYAEFHFYSLVTQFVPDSFVIVGIVAVAASGITAIGLPLALHYWFRSGMQLVFGLVFYGIHFLIAVANLILNSNLTSHGQIPPFITDIYAVYVLPGYIAFYARAWSVIWFVDEDSKRIDHERELHHTEHAARIERKITVTQAQNEAISKAFRSDAAQRTINQWTARNAPKLLAEELGLSMDELGTASKFTFWRDDPQETTAVPGDPPPLPTDAPPQAKMIWAVIGGVGQWVMAFPPIHQSNSVPNGTPT